MRVVNAPRRRAPTALAKGLKRTKPRIFLEWKTLRRWQALPDWEETPPGYLLRLAREAAGITQEEMGRRLGCSQQAIARSERWAANPTVALLRDWAEALDCDLEVSLLRRSGDRALWPSPRTTARG